MLIWEREGGDSCVSVAKTKDDAIQPPKEYFFKKR